MTSSSRMPGEHIADERLVDIALGETSHEDESHLARCRHCRSQVADLVRTFELTREASDVRLEPPPESVWERIREEIADPGVTSEEPPATPAAFRAPRRTWLVALAAGLVLGVAGSVVVDRVREPDDVAPRTVATAELTTLDTGASRGSAVVEERDGRLSLQVTARDVDERGGYAEVWLINRDGERMVSVGVLRDGSGPVRYPVSQALLDQGYDTVDISREKFDAKPEHSGDSVVRGSLSRES